MYNLMYCTLNILNIIQQLDVENVKVHDIKLKRPLITTNKVLTTKVVRRSV